MLVGVVVSLMLMVMPIMVVCVAFLLMFVRFQAFVLMRPLGCFRSRVVFESVSRTQLFAFQALCAPHQLLGAHSCCRMPIWAAGCQLAQIAAATHSYSRQSLR